MIPPENQLQNAGGISIRIVDARSKYVNSRIERAREPITTSGLRQFLLPALLPIMTGNIGSTHGARMVSAPAIKESNSKVIHSL